MEIPWGRAVRAAGLPEIMFHDLRRSAIRNLVRAGVSAHVAMTISGHRSPEVFKRYDIIDQRDKKDALARVRHYQLGGGQ